MAQGAERGREFTGHPFPKELPGPTWYVLEPAQTVPIAEGPGPDRADRGEAATVA
ncbi:hypothetical protein GCM10009579_30790 [Streptomyces javensis]|uniref:Uncharacterized protein n=1 Tax=Streptomyces javensis TaxID=114698 RepID=A0ABP4HJE7_9ACTN